MKRRILAWVMAAVMCLIMSVPALAAPLDLMLATGSDAVYATDSNSGVMLLDLPNDEYGVSILSTFGSVTNTIVNLSNVTDHLYVSVFYVKDETTYEVPITSLVKYNTSDKRYHFTYKSKYPITQINFGLYSSALPTSGTYDMSFDFASDISYDYRSHDMRSTYRQSNVADENKVYTVPVQSFSGDIYMSPYAVNLGSIYKVWLRNFINYSQNVTQVGGSFAFCFTQTDASANVSIGGPDTSVSDYQSSTTSFLGDIVDFFSSLLNKQDTISGNISSFANNVTNSFVNLGSSITNKLADVLSGIQSGLEDVTDGVTSKLSSVSSAITGGYDSSGTDADKDRLDSSISDYEQVENDLVADATDNIDGFVFDLDLSEYLGPIQDISYMLQGLFETMGVMNVAVSFSLMLSVALVLIGWYRFKGG